MIIQKLMNMRSDNLIKILLIGNSLVGKSSLINRYCNGLFPLRAISTKGIRIKTKSIEKNDRRVNLQLWVNHSFLGNLFI